MLLARLAAARDSLARHAGHVDAGLVAQTFMCLAKDSTYWSLFKVDVQMSIHFVR